MAKSELDRLDLNLISFLERNARASLTAIARELGIPRTTVRDRIERMEKNGTISGYTVMLTRNPYEKYARGILQLDVDKAKLNKVVDFIKQFYEVKSCEVVTGECDLLCFCEAPQLEDLDALTSEISAGESIREARFSVVMSTRFERISYNASMKQSFGRDIRDRAAIVGISSGEV